MAKLAPLLLCVTIARLIQSNQAQNFDDVIQNYKDIIEDTTHECTNQSKVNPQLVDDLLHKGIYQENRKLKCYLRCTYLKLGILRPDGSINVNILKQTAGTTDEKILTPVERNCANTTGKDLCEKAFNTSKCTYMTVQSYH